MSLAALVAMLFANYQPARVVLAPQNVKFGICGMDSHPHQDLQKCFRDSDDSELRKVTR